MLASQDGKIVCENTLDARLGVSFRQKLPEVRRLWLFPCCFSSCIAMRETHNVHAFFRCRSGRNSSASKYPNKLFLPRSIVSLPGINQKRFLIIWISTVSLPERSRRILVPVSLSLKFSTKPCLWSTGSSILAEKNVMFE